MVLSSAIVAFNLTIGTTTTATAAIGMTDVVRFKYTPRAKWVLFPYVYDDKIRIESPEDVYDMPDTINKAVRMADEINSSDN